MSARAETPRRPWPPRLELLAVALLLSTYAALAITSAGQKSPTFDELPHLTAGYSYWKLGDFRLHPENGNLPQRLVALPLLFGEQRFPPLDQPAWQQANHWAMSSQFFHSPGNRLQSLLAGRVVVVVIALGLGLLVFAWSRSLFGSAGGLLSLTLYAFSPNLLTHGRLMTSDATFALALIASVWCLWRVLHDVRPRSVLASSVVLGCLVLSKMSSVIILPIALAMALARLISGRPLPLTLAGRRLIRGRRRQALVLTVVALVHLLVVTLLIWAAFDFRYATAAEESADTSEIVRRWDDVLGGEGLPQAAVRLAKTHRLLPEAFLYGFAHTVHHASAGHFGHPAFLRGHYSTIGWWWFFPYSFLIKTPIPLMIILALAGLAAMRRAGPEPRGGSRESRGRMWARVYPALPLWSLVTIYGAASIISNLNIGHRHILPLYPALFILAGSAASWLRSNWRSARLLLALCVVTLAAESLWTWPHYLAYFNQLVGGPRHGYRHLVDSSLDWGQDLPGLRRWLHRRGLLGQRDTPVYLSYFGSNDPAAYDLGALPLPSFFPWGEPADVSLAGGVYCISATMFQGLYGGVPDPWTPRIEQRYQTVRAAIERLEDTRAGSRVPPRADPELRRLEFGRLCAHLRRREPDSHVGYSILIYRLTDEELERALRDPMPDYRPPS